MKKRFFLLSEREQAALIGCHWQTWTRTPFFKVAKIKKKRLEESIQKKGTTTRKAVDYDEGGCSRDGDRWGRRAE